jgi:hypothetical protein
VKAADARPGDIVEAVVPYDGWKSRSVHMVVGSVTAPQPDESGRIVVALPPETPEIVRRHRGAAGARIKVVAAGKERGLMAGQTYLATIQLTGARHQQIDNKYLSLWATGRYLTPVTDLARMVRRARWSHAYNVLDYLRRTEGLRLVISKGMDVDGDGISGIALAESVDGEHYVLVEGDDRAETWRLRRLSDDVVVDVDPLDVATDPYDHKVQKWRDAQVAAATEGARGALRSALCRLDEDVDPRDVKVDENAITLPWPTAKALLLGDPAEAIPALLEACLFVEDARTDVTPTTGGPT